MRSTTLVLTSLLATAFAKPSEFSVMKALPQGYKLNAKVQSVITSGSVSPSTPGLLTGVSTDAMKPFLVSFGGAAPIPMADTDFFVMPQNAQCPGVPPYLPAPAKVGTHSVCVKFGAGKFMWHCPWEFSYGITGKFAKGGCAGVTIDCNDAARTTRIINKYTWIQPRTDDYGPEMRSPEINTYAQACVRHQCQQGPNPGAPPPQPTRLYNSEMPKISATGNMGYMVGFLVASVFVVAGLVFMVVRVGKARAADRGVPLEDDELELSALMALNEDA